MDNSQRLRQALVGRLESLQRAGVLDLPKGVARRRGEAPAAEAGSPERASSEVSISEPLSPAPVPREVHTMPKTAGWKTGGGTLFDEQDGTAGDTSTAATLELLAQEVAACTRCEELACSRTQTVFGVGNPRARLCFIGEAPGADEDREGEPFVGRAGQLLNKIIEACHMRREDVYIGNILKCRPPGNRTPDATEAANCRRFLERQLELIEPEFICCLGAVAAQNLLGTTQSIGKLRGKVHTYRGAKVVCTYHPAYLLRNPAAKKDTWQDMQFLMAEMGVEL